MFESFMIFGFAIVVAVAILYRVLPDDEREPLPDWKKEIEKLN